MKKATTNVMETSDNRRSTLYVVESPGEIIRKTREAKGWSQDDLARETGISQPAINKIENGKTLKSKYFPKIAQVLGIPIEQLDSTLASRSGHRPPPVFLGERDLPVYRCGRGRARRDGRLDGSFRSRGWPIIRRPEPESNINYLKRSAGLNNKSY
jgi:transcriptional regulator with XRE-family HTH domain